MPANDASPRPSHPPYNTKISVDFNITDVLHNVLWDSDHT